jgi:transcriptional regulator with XRE-family HTH domain
MELDLRRLRRSFQLSQVQLAYESGVSLPTIQKIESGRGNPTLEVLEKILSVVGLRVQLKSEEFKADRAISLGVPLTGNKDPMVRPSKEALKLESRRWVHQLMENQLGEREEMAVCAFLLAVKVHFPSVYSEMIAPHQVDERLKQKSKEGKTIKLYRIALRELSRYL